MDNPHYIDEFEDELYITEFAAWVGRNIVGFVHNISKQPKLGKKPLHEWISWFLDWSEYSEYVNWKENEN